MERFSIVEGGEGCMDSEEAEVQDFLDLKKILIACEFSGIVREAFAWRGYDAWSCDLLPSEIPSKKHIQGDVLEILDQGWKKMIAFPPCTHIAVSGMRWFNEGKKPYSLMEKALGFVAALLEAPIPQIALENPVGVISTFIRKPDQIIQPWMFGHREKKATCLWLKNLPHLRPTRIIRKNLKETIWKIAPSPDRWKIRSRTFKGIAEAMADQWGSCPT